MVFIKSANDPFAVLFDPEEFKKRDQAPFAVLLHPIVLLTSVFDPTAVFQEPEVLLVNTFIPITVFPLIFPLPRPTVIPLIFASAVVTRFPLAPERRNDSMLFLLNTRSVLSVVPMNCVRGLVPELPVSPHALSLRVCHVALPETSEVRTYPEVALVVRRRPVNDHVPATLSL